MSAADAAAAPENLLFATTQMNVDATFWAEVEHRKLNTWKLNTPTIDLAASIRSPIFSTAGYRTDAGDLIHNVNVDARAFRGCHNEAGATTVGAPAVNHSFTPAPDVAPVPVSFGGAAAAATKACEIRTCAVRVDFFNCNTVEEYKAVDKKHQIHFVEKDVVALAKEDKIGAIPLTRGYIYSFADLKQHTFEFKTAMPVADFPAAFAGAVHITSRKSLHAFATEKQLPKEWFDHVVAHAGTMAETHPAWENQETRLRIVPFLVPLAGGALPKALKNADLAEVDGSSSSSSNCVIAMLDAGNSNANYPSWVWRNVVTALRVARPQLQRFTILCIRSSAFDGASMVFECKCEKPLGADEIEKQLGDMASAGWHKGSHKIDLSSQMDPVKLADASANLNLQLMKWRMLPTLNLERLGRVRALLLGSGTLGCNIARHLVMWGVRHITMLDRGNVSHSNPVRQTLFEHADVLKEGEERVKSIAAAAALKRILPTVDAKGVNLTIHMPGHRVDAASKDKTISEIEQLRDLITSHDVVFLLTDSRESRWLPTLLCTAHEIPCINAALAFDSYLVMRHGLHRQGPQQVGCYFCNDVVAPIDSLSARSLDQMCTVTRPGVSAMASALAVEMLASLLNHPHKFMCPAWVDEDSSAFDKDVDDKEEACSSVLGIIPHQLRGNISTSFATTVMHGRAYSKCTACSVAVTEAYRKGGVQWVVDVINDPSLLEKVSGLEADKKELEDLGMDADCDFDDDM